MGNSFEQTQFKYLSIKSLTVLILRGINFIDSGTNKYYLLYVYVILDILLNAQDVAVRSFYFAKSAIGIEWEHSRNDKLRKHYLKARGIKRVLKFLSA